MKVGPLTEKEVSDELKKNGGTLSTRKETFSPTVVLFLLIVWSFLSMIGGVYCGYFWGRYDKEEEYKKLLVEKGLADYSPKTGEWQWKE